ncbi:hypothetical protein [Gemmatimonas sp.]|uniref:hypothetical protein n=1 Tax=Gemmatimonas sp. TaxID=1962908 RepID=UPI0025C71A63|nr:hypothetical protein [Gemmatimonas sp.]MCA2992065.1 hypothetical protein [Gemmatimonas sp.]
MTTPRWYRGAPSWLWGAVISLALLAALAWGGWLTLSWARSDERRIVLTEGEAFTRLATQHADSLARVLDSTRRVVAQVETLVVERLVRARQEAAAPLPPATDTTALVAAVQSCRAQLDTLVTDCTAYRRAAATALAQADTIRRSDSTVLAGLSLQLAALRRADSARATQQSRRSRVRVVADGVCAAAVGTHLFQWSR